MRIAAKHPCAHVLQAFFQPVAHRLQFSRKILQAALRKLARHTKADNRRHVFGAGTHAFLMSAAREQRFQLQALVQNQGSCAFGSVNLVRGNCHRMHIERGKIHRDFSKSLHRIGVHPGFLPSRYFGHRGYILDHAGFVVGEHHRHDAGWLRERRFHIGKIHPALAIHRQLAQLPARPCQFLRWFGNTGMFNCAHRDLRRFELRSRTLDKGVVGFGPAAHKYHLHRLNPYCRSDLPARHVYRFPRLRAILMTARGIAVMRA